MYKSTKLAMIAAFVCGFCAFAVHAQPPGSGRGFNMSALIISLPEVNDELKINSRQMKMLEALQADISAQRTRRSSAEERRQRGETNAKLFKVILDKKQAKRFAELELQFESLYAFDREDIGEELKLTDEQLQAIREARREREDATTDPVSVLGGVLEQGQLQKWTSRVGEPFEFSEQAIEFRTWYYGRRFGSRRR